MYLPSVAAMLILIWTNDTMAYFVGKKWGRTKLFERISPKKTWEGSLVGFIACIATGIILQYTAPFANWNWIHAAVIVGLSSQIGDLIESMFKRSLQIKDSGGILPGHGGILDRFDGFLFSMPLLFFYSVLIP